MNIKKTLLTIPAFIGLLSIQATAQSNAIILNKDTLFSKTLVYAGLGFSVPIGGLVVFTVITPIGWGGSATFNIVSPFTENLPSDYTNGSGIQNLFGNNKLRDEIRSFSFRFLKEFPSATKKRRFGLEAGPSFVNTKIPGNFVKNTNPCGFLGCPPSYTYEKVKRNSLGLSLKVKIELLIGHDFGFEMGVISNINPKRSYFGCDFMVMIGAVRDKIKP